MTRAKKSKRGKTASAAETVLALRLCGAEIREVAARWGWDFGALTDAQRDEIEDAIRCWAQ